MYHSQNREKIHSRSKIGRSPPRRRRSPESENKFCLYCKVQVSSSQLYKEHKTTVVHKEKEAVLLKALSDGLQYCYTCEKVFPSKLALDAHCLMTRHKPLYRMDELQEGNINSDRKEISPLPTSANQESRRAKDSKERQDIVVKLNKIRKGDEEKNKVDSKQNVKNGKNFFCEICGVDCMNQSNYKIHIESWRHRAEFDKRRERQEEMEKAKEQRKKFTAEKDYKRVEEESRKAPEAMAEKAGYFCEVCSIASKSESAYLDHLKNRKHFRQVGLMRRPYKCYFCNLEFNIAKDFNHHLESRAHMEQAFNDNDHSRTQEKVDEWVEKDFDKQESKQYDGRKEDIDKRIWPSKKRDRHDTKSNDENKDSHQIKGLESNLKTVDGRKVEIVNEISADGDIKDLREKLKGQKILVTKSNMREVDRSPSQKTNESMRPGEEVDNHTEMNKEKEFEASFEKMKQQFKHDIVAFKEKVAEDREEDISSYQKYETEYQDLSKEEEFIRGNLDSSKGDIIHREECIHDLMKIQNRMQEVRQELANREMRIIKRETLFRESFPANIEEDKVNIDSAKSEGNDYDRHTVKDNDEKIMKDGRSDQGDVNNPDLRIQLERERLIKRLGPELESIDPLLREKLVSVIFERDKEIGRTEDGNDSKLMTDTRKIVTDDQFQKRKSQIEKLSEREKQLKMELDELKSNNNQGKLTKSLVPQYDDVDEKKEQKKRVRKRTMSLSSDSSGSSSSSSSEESDHKSYRRKKRYSPSKSRSKSRRSDSYDRNRRKRRRSSSTEKEKRKRLSAKRTRDEEKKKKLYRSKSDKKKTVKPPVKPGKKEKEKNIKIEHDDSSSDVEEVKVIESRPISVVGSEDLHPPVNQEPQLIPNTTRNQSLVFPAQPKEQFSCWKNPVGNKLMEDSTKEDVWDIAFSGAKKELPVGSTALNLFGTSNETNQLPADILNILKSVAPIFQNNKALSQRSTAVASPFANNSSQSHGNSIPFSSTSSYSNEQGNIESPAPHQKEAHVTKVQSQEENDVTGRFRSILKTMNDQSVTPDQLFADSSRNIDPKHNVIPGLESSPISEVLDHPRTEENTQRPVNSVSSASNDNQVIASNLSTNENTSFSPSAGNFGSHDISLREDQVIQNQLRESDSVGYDRMLQKENKQASESIHRPFAASFEERQTGQRPVGGNQAELFYDESNVDRKWEPYRGPQQTDFYGNDKYRIPADKRRDDHLNIPVGKQGSYDSEPMIRSDRDSPYSRPRAEVTHRVIDYQYVRDTRVFRADENYDNLPLVANSVEKSRLDLRAGDIRPPVKYPGETDYEYYARFEKFYEMKKRSEAMQNDLRRERELAHHSPRLDIGRLDPDQRPPLRDSRLNPDQRTPLRNEIYRPHGRLPVDRKIGDMIEPRFPAPLDNRSQNPPESYARSRDLPLRREDIPNRREDMPNRRAEDPYQDGGRNMPNSDPFKPEEIAKRVEDKPVLEIGPGYHRPDDSLRTFPHDSPQTRDPTDISKKDEDKPDVDSGTGHHKQEDSVRTFLHDSPQMREIILKSNIANKSSSLASEPNAAEEFGQFQDY